MTIDVHILTQTGREQMLQRCLDSIPANITPRVLKLDHLYEGPARYEALMTAPSDADYVSWIDDDDTYIEGGLESCIQLLEQHPECVGAWVKQRVVNEAGDTLEGYFDHYAGRYNLHTHLTKPHYIHPLMVLRKSVALRYADVLLNHAKLGSWALTTHMAQMGPFIRSDFEGYIWHIHDSNDHHIFDDPAAIEHVLNVQRLMPTVFIHAIQNWASGINFAPTSE